MELEVKMKSHAKKLKAKKMKRFILILLCLWTIALMGQNFIDVEKVKFLGVKKLTVQSFNEIYEKKEHRDVYYFDNNGNTLKSSKFVGEKHIESFKYHYDEKGFLVEKTQTYHWNRKYKNEITQYSYTLDSIGRIISRTKYDEKSSWTTFYQDFDNNNNPQTIIGGFEEGSAITKKKYDSFNRTILRERYDDKENILDRLEIKYNELGDCIYTHFEIFWDFNAVIKKHENQYEYLYDKANRWIEKYVDDDGKKQLIEKRSFE